MHPHGPLRGGDVHLGPVDALVGAPLLNGLLLLTLLLLVAAGAYRWRTGSLPFGRPATAPPEDGAKRILADRFGRGEISADEFMERAALLNWTPGVTPPPQHRPRLRRPRRRGRSETM